MDRKIEHIGDGDHPNWDNFNMKETNQKVGMMIKEKILSGEWAPDTLAEINMLREHREAMKSGK